MAKLHLDALNGCRRITEIRIALKNLPSNFSGLYETIMKRIRNQDNKDAWLGLEVLRFVTHLTRPLTLKEFLHLLAFSEDPRCLDFCEAEEYYTVNDLLEVCAGLVVHDLASDTIRLVHFSAEEYFQARNPPLFTDGDTCLGDLVVQYLLRLIEKDAYLDNQEKNLHAEYILAKYTIGEW